MLMNDKWQKVLKENFVSDEERTILLESSSKSKTWLAFKLKSFIRFLRVAQNMKKDAKSIRTLYFIVLLTAVKMQFRVMQDARNANLHCTLPVSYVKKSLQV